MNTNPDETTLALWLEDELAGAELAAVEDWAADRPDQLAARDDVRKWRGMIAAAVPAVEEPPYPEFFNTRILQGIRETVPGAAPVRAGATPFWKAWLMPVAACAGMALAFWTGTQSRHPAGVVSVPPPAAPVVYTPEKGVDAEWFASSPASATVIVLNGVAAIPDDTDFSKTVYLPTGGESERTAALDSPAIDILTP
jgi:hypothetical protein